MQHGRPAITSEFLGLSLISPCLDLPVCRRQTSQFSTGYFRALPASDIYLERTLYGYEIEITRNTVSLIHLFKWYFIIQFFL